MGLTLHYTVRLRDMDRLPELVEEVEDICHSMQWKSNRFDHVIDVEAKAMPFEDIEGDPKPIRLNGIQFTPPECETVFLTFTPAGWSSAFTNLFTAPTLLDHGLDPMLTYCIAVKTQYAGEDMHITLVHLLKYLAEKYFTDVSVLDEGDYWETMDKAVLHERFEVYNGLMDAVCNALESEEWVVTDNPHQLATQLEALLRKRLLPPMD